MGPPDRPLGWYHVTLGRFHLTCDEHTRCLQLERDNELIYQGQVCLSAAQATGVACDDVGFQ